MARENLEIVRRIFEGWATGDVRVGADDLDPHVVFVVPPDFPEFGVFSGPDGIRTLLLRFLEQWERFTLEAKDVRVVGDTVIARLLQHGKGRASGVEGDLEWFMLFTFRGSKIVRMEAVMEEAKALEAVGLAPKGEAAP
jgi:ketosteroid isomerase-like protein